MNVQCISDILSLTPGMWLGNSHLDYMPGIKIVSPGTPEICSSNIPELDHIIFNDPATIVFWKDGTKTVVKTSDDSEFSYYWGFCAAVAEKLFGSNHAVKTAIRKNCNLKLDKQLNLKVAEKSK